MNLSGGECNHIRTGNAEDSIDDNSPPAKEVASRPCSIVWMNCITVSSCAEAEGIVLWISAAHGYQSKHAKTDKKKYLCKRGDNLGFTVIPVGNGEKRIISVAAADVVLVGMGGTYLTPKTLTMTQKAMAITIQTAGLMEVFQY